MPVDVFVFFNGNCREAVTFYAEVFEKELPEFMTYGQVPPDPAQPLSAAGQTRILYTSLNIMGSEVMFSDIQAGLPPRTGNNISLSVGSQSQAEIRQLFDRLKQGGTVELDLQPTFFSGLHGMVRDKYGIGWILTHVANTDGPSD